MNRTVCYVALCLSLIVVCVISCSTIMNGTTQNITVLATPSDASISVDGARLGSGTLTYSVSRRNRHLIEVAKDGYRTVKIKTGNSTEGWFWGNIISWGVAGMVVDMLTGSAYKTEPENIVVKLTEGSGAPIVQSHDTDGFIIVGIVTLVLTALYVSLFWDPFHPKG
jgi:hypothetical protein